MLNGKVAAMPSFPARRTQSLRCKRIRNAAVRGAAEHGAGVHEAAILRFRDGKP